MPALVPLQFSPIASNFYRSTSQYSFQLAGTLLIVTLCTCMCKGVKQLVLSVCLSVVAIVGTKLDRSRLLGT